MSQELVSEAQQGTNLFLAPEVIHGEICQASDIWSLGVTLYALACGRLPFANLDEILNKTLNWDFASQLRIKLTDDFKENVAAMLNKEPQARPTAKELSSILF